MTIWRKSSYTGGGNDDACVEVADLAAEVWVRDSKNPSLGRLELRREAFAALLMQVKRGELGS